MSTKFWALGDKVITKFGPGTVITIPHQVSAEFEHTKHHDPRYEVLLNRPQNWTPWHTGGKNPFFNGDDLKPISDSLVQINSLIAAALPEPLVVDGYDSGFRDALESMVLALDAKTTYPSLRSAVETALGAHSNDAPETCPVTADYTLGDAGRIASELAAAAMKASC